MNTKKHRLHGFKVMFNIAAIMILGLAWLMTFSMSMHHHNGSSISQTEKKVPHNPTEGMEDFVNGDAKLDGRRGGKSAHGAKV